MIVKALIILDIIQKNKWDIFRLKAYSDSLDITPKIRHIQTESLRQPEHHTKNEAYSDCESLHKHRHNIKNETYSDCESLDQPVYNIQN